MVTRTGPDPVTQTSESRITVCLKDATSRALVEAKAVSLGATLVDFNPEFKTIYLSVASGKVFSTLCILEDLEAVAWVNEPVIRSRQSLQVPGELFASQKSYLDLMHIEAAWTVCAGDPNFIIADVDSGADLTHPLLKDHLILPMYTEPTGRYTTYDLSVNDSLGHGTATASCIAAVAPLCLIRPYRMTGDGNNIGNELNNALSKAIDDGCKVINCSYNGANPYITISSINSANSFTIPGNGLVAATGNRILVYKMGLDYDSTVYGTITATALTSDGQHTQVTVDWDPGQNHQYPNQTNQFDASYTTFLNLDTDSELVNKKAWDAGALIVWSAGNDHLTDVGEVCGRGPYTISVGGAAPTGVNEPTLAWYSTVGAWVDIVTAGYAQNADFSTANPGYPTYDTSITPAINPGGVEAYFTWTKGDNQLNLYDGSMDGIVVGMRAFSIWFPKVPVYVTALSVADGWVTLSEDMIYNSINTNNVNLVVDFGFPVIGMVHAGSNLITDMSATTTITPGDRIYQPGIIPEYATIVSIDSATQITMSDVGLADTPTPIEINANNDLMYGLEAGTSFCAPTCSGAAALIKIKNPGFTTAQLIAKLKGTADPLAQPSNHYIPGGYKLLNMAAALGFTPDLFINTIPQLVLGDGVLTGSMRAGATVAGISGATFGTPSYPTSNTWSIPITITDTPVVMQASYNGSVISTLSVDLNSGSTTSDSTPAPDSLYSSSVLALGALVGSTQGNSLYSGSFLSNGQLLDASGLFPDSLTSASSLGAGSLDGILATDGLVSISSLSSGTLVGVISPDSLQSASNTGTSTLVGALASDALFSASTLDSAVVCRQILTGAGSIRSPSGETTRMLSGDEQPLTIYRYSGGTWR